MIFALAMWEPQPDATKVHACGLRGSKLRGQLPVGLLVTRP